MSERQTEYLSPSGVLIFAHRGLAGPDAPENTLAAFGAALKAGATHIETDIQVSKDGVAVLFHDDDLGRVAGVSKRVDELTWEEIGQIHVQGQRIPSLAEALTAFPQARFNLDIKTSGAIEPATKVILSQSAQNRVLVSSFSARRRLAALALFEFAGAKVATSADGQLILSLLFAVAMNNFLSFAKKCEEIDALQIPTSYFGISLKTKRMLAFAKKAGVQVHYWVVNDPTQMKKLVTQGASGIVTDVADIAVKTLRR